jgi:hypothetical protein
MFLSIAVRRRYAKHINPHRVPRGAAMILFVAVLAVWVIFALLAIGLCVGARLGDLQQSDLRSSSGVRRRP